MIVNFTRSLVLAQEVAFATTSRQRRRGLIGRSTMGPSEAMVFHRCRQVHSFGMRFPIDVLFLDREGRALSACERLKPYRFSPWVHGAKVAVEMPAGTIERTRTSRGDKIIIVPRDSYDKSRQVYEVRSGREKR